MSPSESPLDYPKACTMTKQGSPLSRQVSINIFFFLFLSFWREENWKLSGPVMFPDSPSPQTSWEDAWKMTVHNSVFRAALCLCGICKAVLHLFDVLERSVNCTEGFSPLSLASWDWRDNPLFCWHCTCSTSQKNSTCVRSALWFLQGHLRSRQQIYSNIGNSVKQYKYLVFSTLTSKTIWGL